MTRVRRALWIAGWPVRALLLMAIWVYRVTLGGMLGGGCRFHPSCSAYAESAIRELGAVRGVGLATWRVLRCSPLTGGGVDYPPRRREATEPAERAGYDAVIPSTGSGAVARQGTPA
jgi:uncharacterized protein